MEPELARLGHHFLIQLDDIWFYWLTGLVLGSLISVFGKAKLQRLFLLLQGRSSRVSGLALASLLGLASPLCLYGTIPVAASFAQKGARDDWLAAFMMSSILLNPQLLLYSAALGPEVLLIRLTSCFFGGLGAGLSVRYFYRKREFFNFTGFALPPNRDIDQNPLLRLLKNIGRNLKATGPHFGLGIVLAALFQTYVPADNFTRFFGSQNGTGILLAAVLGVPIYVCGGGTIALLSSWLQSGLGLGAATAFMITGPATKITNLGAVKIVLGLNRFIIYLVFSLVLALSCGLMVNLFFLP